jgi:hypothetical protein
MKPILVLRPARSRGSSPSERRRVDLRRLSEAEAHAVDAMAWSAVVVLDDGDAETVRRLLLPLPLRIGLDGEVLSFEYQPV